MRDRHQPVLDRSFHIRTTTTPAFGYQGTDAGMHPPDHDPCDPVTDCWPQPTPLLYLGCVGTSRMDAFRSILSRTMREAARECWETQHLGGCFGCAQCPQPSDPSRYHC